MWNGSLGSGNNHEVSPGSGTIDHVFTLETQHKLRSVMVDPRTRLLEEPQGPRRNVDPLYNNRSPTSFRFVYTGFGFEVSASEFLAGQTPAARLQALSGRVLFEMSRRRDLDRSATCSCTATASRRRRSAAGRRCGSARRSTAGAGAGGCACSARSTR